MLNALIIEPNKKLGSPYNYISGLFNIVHVANVESGLVSLSGTLPQVVFLSTNIGINKTLMFLEALKNASHKKLIPLIFVIDLTNKLNTVPGTTWGGKIGILHSMASKTEFNSTMNRVLESQ
ncbi:hypothetical protein A2957_00435 [Candidatus Roizmanbacteria bacterium RIFCSPLOWO2_01_FULL_38_11]|uniref:Response regulatory domain-containing protein n=1 Tax=Candidatus Roizmanbacteria bacterium RIFCSPLOWO2_01_FULL_38_11 TaxID=1802060 RepID=A0A1F7IKK2_9BACT|nr:MAG: hypothetical protein A2957_00435 [Candidatus Roizmanbacteria bacterium RIFCSPLOWO2_01_FULL_38_11]